MHKYNGEMNNDDFAKTIFFSVAIILGICS